MSVVEMILFGVALSMDAFAVAVCKGLAMKKARLGNMAVVGAWFGIFQGLMPLIGFYLGRLFGKWIEAVDHWVAFALLLLIGLMMIKEAFSGGEEEGSSASLAPGSMLLLSLATSLDAMAVGIAFSLSTEQVPIFAAVAWIAGITFLISAVGVGVGAVFGARFRGKAQLFGGVVLILLGTKILLEDLGVVQLPF